MAPPAVQTAPLCDHQTAAVIELCGHAFALQRSGRLPDAMAVYRQLLALAPDHFDALHQLGRLAHAARSHHEAEGLLARAVRAEPRSAEAHLHHGMALAALRRLEDAKACYLRAIALQPNDVAALNELGIACRLLKHPAQSLEHYDKAIAINGSIAELHYNRGLSLLDLQRCDEAVASFDRALAVNPRHLASLTDRGNALFRLRRFDEALAGYGRALAVNPTFADAHNGRGAVMINLRNYHEALASLERALAVNPNHADALANRATVRLELGELAGALADADRAAEVAPQRVRAWECRAQALLRLDRVSDAVASCQHAIGLSEEQPSPIAVVTLGLCLARLGQTDDAIASFDVALQIKPDLELAIANKIFLLDFVEAADFEAHRDARRMWWQHVGSPVAASPPYRHPNSRDGDRRLVLGYLSADFRAQSAALVFKPILQRHDKAAFEIICYSCSALQDAVTEEFRQVADRWRDASQWSDERLAAQIRSDAVDILIDLSGHTAGNRLGVLARKPAPVQVHGWGHVIPPGLPTIDYVLADPVLIPSAVRHLYCETIYDLPCLLTIDALPAGVPHAETPALQNGFVTFGVFNRINKISDAAAALWARILAQVPQARLLIKHHTLDDAAVAANLLARFARHGAPVARIDLLGASARGDHLAALNRVDICLDPFPTNGGVSTWESLQMGVPVIAKLGKAPSARAAGAILTAIGMQDWVAETDQEYLDIAVARASQIEALAQTRRELPGRLAASAAGNPALYAAAVDQAYRAMWRTWCAQETAAGR